MIELPPNGTRGTDIPGWARPVFKALGGIGGLMFRFGVKVQGRPLLELTTIGARTGKRHKAVLGWFSDGEAWVIVGSNGGAIRHPGWAYNLAAHPDQATADIGDGVTAIDVELLRGTERERMWAEVVELAPGYGVYTEKTDRAMPLFRLTPRS